MPSTPQTLSGLATQVFTLCNPNPSSLHTRAPYSSQQLSPSHRPSRLVQKQQTESKPVMHAGTASPFVVMSNKRSKKGSLRRQLRRTPCCKSSKNCARTDTQHAPAPPRLPDTTTHSPHQPALSLLARRQRRVRARRAQLCNVPQQLLLRRVLFVRQAARPSVLCRHQLVPEAAAQLSSRLGLAIAHLGTAAAAAAVAGASQCAAAAASHARASLALCACCGVHERHLHFGARVGRQVRAHHSE